MEMPELQVIGPGRMPPEEYFRVRGTTLRLPLGFAKGSEHLADDEAAIHAWLEDEAGIISVGRAHLIAAGDDGAMQDHDGEDSVECPPFTPLLGETGFPPPQHLRPAFHIRQMGTVEERRRQGHAAIILKALEQAAVTCWSCNSGWLQARTQAVPFYESQGWKSHGDEFFISGIGPHLSMWKRY